MSDAAASDPFGSGLPLDTVVTRPRAHVILLEVDGEVDSLTAPRLEAGLEAALAGASPDDTDVVVDLSGVTFLASSGLAVLIGAARRVSASDMRLHLVAASRAVTRPLEVTGADALFDVHADVAAALAAATPGVAPPHGE